MLTIRQEQIDAFRAAMRADFERRAMAFLQECWPAECEALGDALHAFVVRGIGAAARYGFTIEHVVLRYLSLTISIGEDLFEEAHSILADGGTDQVMRISALELHALSDEEVS